MAKQATDVVIYFDDKSYKEFVVEAGSDSEAKTLAKAELEQQVSSWESRSIEEIVINNGLGVHVIH